jgi:hypothetical protein
MTVSLIIGGWFWHPLRNGPGYNFWSGIAGCFLFSIPGWIAAAVIWIRSRNCHVYGCWRLQWYEHPDHGHPVCRKHHPDGQGRGDHLAARHHIYIGASR